MTRIGRIKTDLFYVFVDGEDVVGVNQWNGGDGDRKDVDGCFLCFFVL